MNTIQAIILAIIEGLTEFLPVSSTGHMIIASSVMGIQSNDFVKLFTVAIQLGTIISVIVLYFRRFFRSLGFYFKLFVAFIPAAILGFAFSKYIDRLLESPLGVAISLVLGGIILLFVDKWFRNATIDDSDKISYPTAFRIGLYQCIAMIPGVSRSGATIIGGMTQRLTRKAAAEFSFFLAVPTMLGATVKSVYDYYQKKQEAGIPELFSPEEIRLLAIGNIVGFLVAMIAIRTFIGFLAKNGFRVFGIYRIIVGGIILVMMAMGHTLEIL